MVQHLFQNGRGQPERQVAHDPIWPLGPAEPADIASDDLDATGHTGLVQGGSQGCHHLGVTFDGHDRCTGPGQRNGQRPSTRTDLDHKIVGADRHAVNGALNDLPVDQQVLAELSPLLRGRAASSTARHGAAPPSCCNSSQVPSVAST
jgi:hypothetical protein